MKVRKVIFRNAVRFPWRSGPTANLVETAPQPRETWEDTGSALIVTRRDGEGKAEQVRKLVIPYGEIRSLYSETEPAQAPADKRVS